MGREEPSPAPLSKRGRFRTLQALPADTGAWVKWQGVPTRGAAGPSILRGPRMARTARSELALGVGGPGARGGVCLKNQTGAPSAAELRKSLEERQTARLRLTAWT